MTQIDSRKAGKEQVYQIAPVTQVNILYLFYYSYLLAKRLKNVLENNKVSVVFILLLLIQILE